MSDTLAVTVNNQTKEVPADFGSSAQDLLDLFEFVDRKYDLYRTGHKDDGADLKDVDRCGEPLVVGDGDEFAAIPRYLGDA